MRYYVSQVAVDTSVEPPRTGYMHFVTDNEAKARSEAAIAVPDQPRYLLVFDDAGLLHAGTPGCPAGVLASAQRKEEQRLKLEAQAAAAP